MRKELRYMMRMEDLESLKNHFSQSTEGIDYKVSNFYLDNKNCEFSRTEKGSPRFRVRLYEVDNLVFGNLEIKRVLSKEECYTSKSVWDMRDYWHELSSLIPELCGKVLRSPTAKSPFSCLVQVAQSGELINLDDTFLINSLSYYRSSFRFNEFRITVDYGFHPNILQGDSVIVECKGDDETGVFDIVMGMYNYDVLDMSKFSLLAKLFYNQEESTNV
jgi:hypothetical protein